MYATGISTTDGSEGGDVAFEDDRWIKIRRQVDELKRDGVACGTRGLGALSCFFLGSFTQRLSHVAPCPVLTVREAGAIEGALGREGKTAEVGR